MPESLKAWMEQSNRPIGNGNVSLSTASRPFLEVKSAVHWLFNIKCQKALLNQQKKHDRGVPNYYCFLLSLMFVVASLTRPHLVALHTTFLAPTVRVFVPSHLICCKMDELYECISRQSVICSLEALTSQPEL